MRIALISDSHTKENIEFILSYLRRKAGELKIDAIIINGDILGENEIREGYGYNFNKTLFYAGINKDELLKRISGLSYENLKSIQRSFEHSNEQETEIAFAGYIRDYVELRHYQLLEILKESSEIAKTYFNPGNYESPLHYNVLKELAFLLDIQEPYLRKVAMLSNYRDIYKEFAEKLKAYNPKRLIYLGGKTAIEQEVLIAGIPGFNPSSLPEDSFGEFQEKITEDLLNTVRRQLSYASKLILLNQTQGRLRKDPFAFRPQSQSVRSFIDTIKGKLRQKIYVQSYHHFMTTHFYDASEFSFILNNAAVNNCLFNLVDTGNKANCYDVDPKLDKIRLLKHYNYEVVDYDSPFARLSLNYEDAKEVISERNLDGCYYI